jgi:invasion protein IalB
MPDLRLQSLALLLSVLVSGTAGAVFAQERTSATYKNWTLECDMQAGPPARKTCHISQLTQTQGHPFSRIAIERPAPGQQVALEVQLPVNVSLRTNVRIQTIDSDPGLAAPFDHCVPGGCFADFVLNTDAIKKFRSAGETGKITFKSANGRRSRSPCRSRASARLSMRSPRSDPGPSRPWPTAVAARGRAAVKETPQLSMKRSGVVIPHQVHRTDAYAARSSEHEILSKPQPLASDG